MGRSNLRGRDVNKQVAKQQARNTLLNNPRTPLGLATALRTRRGGKDAGYLNTLNRLQKKCVGQLRGVPGCGPTVRDWLTGYE